MNHRPINMEQEFLTIEQELADMEQESLNIDQESPDIDQESSNIDLDTTNIDQELLNIEQESRKLEQELTNMEQESPDIVKESPNIVQQSPNIVQEFPIIEQELANMEQESPNIGQESSNTDQEFQNMEEEPPNMEQQSPDALEKLPSRDVESSCPSIEVDEEPDKDTQDLPVTCRECNAFVKGYRFACVSCDGCVVCVSCASRGVHPMCYVLRVPPLRPLWEVQAVLRAVRGSLAMSAFADRLAEPLADYPIAEIKSESEDDSDREIDGTDQNKCQEDEVVAEAVIRGTNENEGIDPLAEFKPSENMSPVLSIDCQSRGDPTFVVQTTDDARPQTCDMDTQTDPISHSEASGDVETQTDPISHSEASGDVETQTDPISQPRSSGDVETQTDPISHPEASEADEAVLQPHVNKSASEAGVSDIITHAADCNVPEETNLPLGSIQSLESNKVNGNVSEPANSQSGMPSNVDVSNLPTHEIKSAATSKGNQETKTAVQPRLRTRSERESASNSLPVSSIDNQSRDDPSFIVQTSDNHILHISDMETHIEAQTDSISHPEALGSDKAVVEADCNKSETDAGHTNISDFIVPNKRVRRLRSASKSDKVKENVSEQTKSQISLKRRRPSVLDTTELRAYQFSSAAAGKLEASPAVQARLRTRSERESTSNSSPVSSIDNQPRDDPSFVVQTSDDHMLQTSDVETHAEAQTDPISHPEASGSGKAVVEADCNRSETDAGHTNILDFIVPNKRVRRLRSASKSDKVKDDVSKQKKNQIFLKHRRPSVVDTTESRTYQFSSAAAGKQEAPSVVQARLRTRSERESTSNSSPVSSIDNQLSNDPSFVMQTSDDHMLQTSDVETHAETQTDPEASGSDKVVVEADCNESKTSAGISKLHTTDKIHTVHIANFGVPQKRVLRLRSAPSSKPDNVKDDVAERMKSQNRTNKRSHKRASVTGGKQEAPPVVKAKLRTRSKRKSTSNRLPVPSMNNQFRDDPSFVVQTSDDHLSQTFDVETHAKAQTDPIFHPEASGANKAVVEPDCKESKSSAGISKIHTTDKIYTMRMADFGVPQKRIRRLRSAPSLKSDEVKDDVSEPMSSQKRTNNRSYKRASAAGKKQEAPPVVKAKLRTRSKRKSTSNMLPVPSIANQFRDDPSFVVQTSDDHMSHNFDVETHAKAHTDPISHRETTSARKPVVEADCHESESDAGYANITDFIVPNKKVRRLRSASSKSDKVKEDVSQQTKSQKRAYKRTCAATEKHEAPVVKAELRTKSRRKSTSNQNKKVLSKPKASSNNEPLHRNVTGAESRATKPIIAATVASGAGSLHAKQLTCNSTKETIAGLKEIILGISREKPETSLRKRPLEATIDSVTSRLLRKFLKQDTSKNKSVSRDLKHNIEHNIPKVKIVKIVYIADSKN